MLVGFCPPYLYIIVYKSLKTFPDGYISHCVNRFSTNHGDPPTISDFRRFSKHRATESSQENKAEKGQGLFSSFIVIIIKISNESIEVERLVHRRRRRTWQSPTWDDLRKGIPLGCCKNTPFQCAKGKVSCWVFGCWMNRKRWRYYLCKFQRKFNFICDLDVWKRRKELLQSTS